jgi:hypothetical protein
MRSIRRNALTLLYLLLAGMFSLSLCAQGVQTKRPNVPINANCNGYLEYLPPNYNPTGNQTYPLLLFFNGHGSQGPGTSTSLDLFFTGAGTPADQCNLGWWVPSFTVNGQSFSFIVITPQFVRTFCCEAMPTAQEVDGIIDYMVQNYKVDVSRIYMTGVSSGAFVPFEYAAAGLQYANRVAAIVPFATTSWGTQSKADILAQSDLPVWAFHNQYDVNVFSINTTNWISSINNPTPPIAPPSPVALATIFPNQSSHVCWWDPYMRIYTENGKNIYEWMLQYTRPVASPSLPVVFSLLNASCNNGAVNLSWKTSSEVNTVEFGVEKSSDGRNWSNIATVKATGQNGGGQTYKVYDNSGSGSLYRVVANDIDGKKTYSSVIKGACTDGAFSVYPNPVLDKAAIGITLTSASKIKLSIIDSKGSTVLQEQQVVPAGSNILTMNLANLPKGIYSLNAVWNAESRSLRFVKQ